MVIQTDSSYNPNWKQFSYNHEKSVLQSSLSSAIIYKMLFMCAMSDIAGLGPGIISHPAAKTCYGNCEKRPQSQWLFSSQGINFLPGKFSDSFFSVDTSMGCSWGGDTNRNRSKWRDICIMYTYIRRSQTAGHNSCSIASGYVSNCSYRLKAHPVTSSCLSSA